MFVSSFVFSPVGSPSNTVSFRPARLFFRLNLNRPEKLAILLSLACSTLTGKERANASLTRLERTRNYWRVNLFSSGFPSRRRARHATSISTVPVETSAPPFTHNHFNQFRQTKVRQCSQNMPYKLSIE